MMFICEDCRRLTSGDCGKHGSLLTAPRMVGTLDFSVAVDPVPLRCAHSGNPCGTDTVHNGNACQCIPCRQWRYAFREGLEAAGRLAAPYHNSLDGRGCKRFCTACERSREIQEKIGEAVRRL